MSPHHHFVSQLQPMVAVICAHTPPYSCVLFEMKLFHVIDVLSQGTQTTSCGPFNTQRQLSLHDGLCRKQEKKSLKPESYMGKP